MLFFFDDRLKCDFGKLSIDSSSPIATKCDMSLLFKSNPAIFIPGAIDVRRLLF